MYQDKLVYMSKYPVYWCPKCVSAIAKAELDDVEKDGTLNHIKFTGPKGEDLIIATTRPELIHACVAVLFHPEDERYRHLDGKMITTALGKQVMAIPDKDVDKEFGTGLVMVCTFGDKMDVVWMHRYKLPMIEAMDQHGRLINAGEYDGKKAEEAKALILAKLENEGKVVKKEQLKQTVKVHDRCKTPIELLPSLQWFADIRTTAKNIKALAQKIEWMPDFGISYLIDWVEGAEWDWVISRQSVFGTPLPFYYCPECRRTEAAAGNELPFYPEKAKPRACGSCNGPMKAETSTCDCWVDSSITPLIISGWPDDMEKMNRIYPVSLRPQGVEIVRTWAFYTIYRSGVALTGIPPFKTILLNGNVLAPDGKKMSKSLGNIISPTELLQEYPTDAIRQWAAMSGAMAKDRPFSFEDIKYAKSFLNKLWNAARFVETCGKERRAPQDAEFTIIDRWMLGRLSSTVKDCSEHMERFEYHYAIGKLHAFFWHDFCDNYIEYVKHRVYEDSLTKAEDPGRDAALHTLNAVLHDTIRLLAPITPHISEEIHAALYGPESIHRSPWPSAGKTYEKEAAQMTAFNEVVSQLRQYKSRSKLPQNAELMKVRISTKEEFCDELARELKKVSKIKELERMQGEFSVSVL